MHTPPPKIRASLPGGRVGLRPLRLPAARPAEISGRGLLDAVPLDQKGKLARRYARGVLDVRGQLGRGQVMRSAIGPRAQGPIFCIVPTSIGPIARKARELLRYPGAAARDSARGETCFNVTRRQQPGQREPGAARRPHQSPGDALLFSWRVTIKARRHPQHLRRVAGNLPIRGVTCHTQQRENESDRFQHKAKTRAPRERNRGAQAQRQKP